MIGYSEVYAFTDTPGFGNRAGVVLDARTLSDRQMQALARHLDAPETVFVTDLDRRGATVRYFTPTQEIEFCGHATLALGLMLAQQGLLRHGQDYPLHTLVGTVPLRLDGDNQELRIWMQQPELDVRPLPGALRAEFAEALGINERVIHRGLPLAAASAGGWSAFVPLLDQMILDALEPDLDRIRTISESLGIVSVYAYAPVGVNRFAARDFAPAVGIPEDPVTGSAGGALLGLLASQGRLPVRGDRAAGTVYQGHVLGTPGEVEVEVLLRGDRVTAIRVGGRAVMDREGHWLPNTPAR